MLTPPLPDARDHIVGPQWASASLAVFGSYGTPASQRLGRLLDATGVWAALQCAPQG